MATIILGTIGRFIGGPIGGAIGSVLGQVVDSSIFGSKAIQGPRLKELGVQTSGYGSNIPAVYGAVRIAGSVIWATDLIESKSKSGGGKGRPKTVSYSYSVSFAVALSCRPSLRIGRIWADGNLLRGAAGDFKTTTGFRFYSGHGDQALDPLIASAHGVGACPAFRGISYAVFEDMQLADFGNRIPSLTFEVFERDGDVLASAVASDISGGQISSESAEKIAGYALEGSDARSALSPLIENLPVILRPEAGDLGMHDWNSAALRTSAIDIAISADRSEFRLPRRIRGPSGKLPHAVALRHYEPARDFQTGVQRSQISDTGRVAVQIDFPVSLDANAARRLADLQLLQTHKSRDQWTGYAASGENALKAGDWIADPDADGRWQIAEIEHQLGASRISARRSVSAYQERRYTADAGQSLPSPDVQAGLTQLALMDLPALDSNDTTQPIVAIAAAGTAPGWRSAALSVLTPNGLSDIGITAAPAVMGTTTDILPPHSPYLLDKQSVLTVQLLHQGMALPPGTGDPVSSGASLCWIGGELIRAGHAQFVGANQYLLTMLQRGCYGTEYAISDHKAGETFVLLEADSIRGVDNGFANIGTSLTVEALGIGDFAPVPASIQVRGLAVRPFAPVHGGIERAADGALKLSWVRRTRIQAGWQDNVDVPMIEGNLQYEISISRNGLSVALAYADAGEMLISAAQLTAWGVMPIDELTFQIAQIGRYGRSLPLILQYEISS